MFALLVLAAAAAAAPVAVPAAQTYVDPATGEYDWLELAKLSDEELAAVLPADFFEHDENLPEEIPEELIHMVWDEFAEMFPTETDLPGVGRVVEAARPLFESGEREVQPIVIVPGFLSSALINTFERPVDVPAFCSSGDVIGTYQLWLNIPRIIRIRCFHNIFKQRLTVERDGNVTYSRAEGTNIRGKDFGGTDGVETLCFFARRQAAVFRTFVEALVELGWRRDVSVRAATFDWSFPVWELNRNGIFDQLAAMVEETYSINGNKSVHLLGHSMGTLFTLEFLNSRSDSWKAQYVASNLAVTPLYLGAPLAIRAAITGVTNIPLVRWYLSSLMKNWGSLHQFNPVPAWNDRAFVFTPDRQYTSADLEDLYNDAGLPDVGVAVPLAYAQVAKMIHPGVEYHCFVVTGFDTDVAFNYTNGLPRTFTPHTRPIIIREDGDGLVPVTSARYCQEFQPTVYREYGETNHVGVLSDPRFIADIVELIGGGAKH